MEKVWIPVIVSIVVLGGFVYAYFYYDNQNVREENLAVSIYYLQNVTSVESAEILLDFSNQRMKIESTFLAKGYHIGLDTGSRGFQDRDSSCSNGVNMIFANEKEQHLVWDSRDIIEFDNIGPIEKVELQKTCAFSKKLAPNGEFVVHLFGKNQTLGIDVNKITFTMIFDSDTYRCEEFCVFSEQFELIDIENDDGITIVKTVAKNPDTRRMDFDFRTKNFEAERYASIFFVLIQVGIGATLTMVVYALTTRQQKKSQEILNKVKELGEKQKKIIDDQNERNLKKKETGEFFITHTCQMLTIRSIDLFNNFQNYLNKKSTKEEWETQLEQWKYSRDLAIDHLENHHGIYSDVLNHNTNLWLFELVEDLKMFSKPAFESEAGNALLWGLFTAIMTVGKTLTSEKLKQSLDDNRELQKILAVGKNKIESFVVSSKFDEALNLMGLSKKDIEKFKKDFKKST